MIFRDLNYQYEKPYQDGKWIYPDPIYDNILNCFLRTQRPEGIYKEKNYIGSQNYIHDKAEEEIITSWITSKNIKVKRTSRSWSMRGMNNFIILDYEITNLNQETIDDFYFCNVFLLRPSFLSTIFFIPILYGIGWALSQSLLLFNFCLLYTSDAADE